MATPDDLVHCPICLELYDQPRALPCLHTFCSTCIQEYINAAAARATSITKGFECPVCRRHTDPPGSANVSEWSSLFPLNHIILSLIDSRTDINTKKRDKELDACDKNTDINGKRLEVASSRPPRITAETKEAPVDDDFFDFEKKADESTIGCDEDDINWPPPPPFLLPHGPSHWGPPPHRPHHRHCHPRHRPPHHHGPSGHGPPPHGPPGHGPPPHGPPGHGPPPHWPPPPHHRGRGCHRPGGRFHHPH